jgi:hypothetical protein
MGRPKPQRPRNVQLPPINSPRVVQLPPSVVRVELKPLLTFEDDESTVRLVKSWASAADVFGQRPNSAVSHQSQAASFHTAIETSELAAPVVIDVPDGGFGWLVIGACGTLTCVAPIFAFPGPR